MMKIHGLVVCGGKSSRMGHDKSMISYHGLPQWQHTANLIAPFCPKVFISCNAGQVGQFKTAHALLIDDVRYANCGPMAALLTAFRTYPSSPFLVLGCDYPLITAEDLKNLVDSRQDDADAVCLYHEVAKIEEPLAAVYEPSIYPALVEHFKNSDFSLRKVLLKTGTIPIRPATPISLATADTPHEARELQNKIRTSGSTSLNFNKFE